MKKTCSNSTSLHQRQLNLSKLPESSCGASFKDNQHHQFLFSIASAGRTRNDNSFSPMVSVSRFLSLMGAFLFPQVDRHLVSSEQTKETKNTSTNLCILFVPTFYANARIQKNCQIPQDFFYNMLKVKEKNHINAEDLYHEIYSKSGVKKKSTESRQK